MQKVKLLCVCTKILSVNHILRFVHVHMTSKAKIKLGSRRFKLQMNRSIFAVISIMIVVYLGWLFAFPMFGPVIANFFDGYHALDIEKGQWSLLFLASMAASCLVSGFLVDKTSKRIVFFLFSTLVASALTFAFLWVNFGDIYVFSVLLGLAAGVSPVAWGAYFADHSSPEERGRIMGILVGPAMIFAQLFLISEFFESASTFSTMNVRLLLVGGWLLVTFAVLAFRPKEKTQETSKKRKGPSARQIVLYAIPMFLFYLVAGILLSIVFPSIQNHVDNWVFYVFWAVPFLLGSIFVGQQLDLRGRKFPIILGLAITGVSLAIIGIMGLTYG
jgi:MFS family permease